MGVRRNTTNRLTLYRTCHVCGQTMITTADTPFVRQLPGVGGKKQKTCYFCSESCKNSTYLHNFDGLYWKRKEEYDRERDARRDRGEENRRYYAAHREAERERTRRRFSEMSDTERDALNTYRRARHRANREDDNRKRREYRARKKQEERTETN